MFTGQHGPGAILVVLALAIGPALLRWWWGRSLARLADDPLIAERLHAHHSRVGMLILVCLIALGVVRPAWAIVTIPLLFLAQSIASYPLTRTLYGETWTLGASVSFYARLPLAVFGFWALLAATPWVVSLAAAWDWIAAALFAAVLVAWDWYYADVVRALLRCEPVSDRRLLDRFATLVSRSGIPEPRFECVPMKGGVLANALALPSLRQSSVLFSETLLSRLEPEQTVAICAHEIAHLEYYDRRRMRRLQIANWFLIAVICAMTPASRTMFSSPDDRRLPAIACTVAVVVALALRGRHRQRHETASDVRAVELTGDPEALASALTALHTIARVPRRWDQQREQQATHPSLARRIRDIHAAAGTAPAAPLEHTAAFAAARGDAVVTFDKAHLHWQDAPGSTHVLEYGALSELRLHVSPLGEATLVAVERQGRRWTMPSRPQDAAALQSMLDSVDGRLATPARSLAIAAPLTRVVAIFACTLAAMLGQFAFALVAILTALAPAAAMLYAAGAAAFVTAAVILAHSGEDAATRVAFAFILGVLGAGFLLMARSRRADATQPPRFAIVIIAAAAFGATAGIMLGGLDPVRLHQGARDLPAAPVLLVALGAACWGWRQRPQVRHAPLAAALTGATIVAAGSTPFLEHVGRDPFLVEAAPLRWAIADAEPETSFDLPFPIESLRLSPSGALAAVVRAATDEGSMRAAPVFHVRRADGTLMPVKGSDLAFVDDRSALVLELDGDGAVITIASFDGAPAIDWRERLAGIRTASLTYGRARNQWTLIGRDEDGNVIRATGAVGRAGVQQTIWKGPEDEGGWINAIGVRGDAAIALQKNYDNGVLGRGLAMRLPVALVPTFPQTRIWRLGPGDSAEADRSLLDVTCGLDSRDGEAMVCTAFDGANTRIVALDPSTAGVTAIGSVDGMFYASPSNEPGWLSGWWRSAQAVVHLETRLLLRLPYHPDEYVSLVAPGESVIGAAAPIDGGTRVRLYPMAVAMNAVSRAE